MAIDLWRFGTTDFTLAGATNVVDLSGALKLPSARGDNPEIPMREGRPHVAKLYDQRVVTLGMALTGSSVGDFESKLDTLNLLFGARNRQYLQRTLAGGAVRRALAEVSKCDVKLDSPASAKLTVDFLLAEPFFRSTTQVNDLQTISASPYTYTLTHPGTADERSALITLTGPLSYPKLSNLSTGVWVGYNDVIATDVAVVIDSAAFTCKQGSTSLLSKYVHAGDAYAMVFAPGANNMQVEASATGGTVRIQFYPAYF